MPNSGKHELEFETDPQRRSKDQQEKLNLIRADMLLLAEDNTPAIQWTLGIVLEAYTGNDALVRVANTKKRRRHRDNQICCQTAELASKLILNFEFWPRKREAAMCNQKPCFIKYNLFPPEPPLSMFFILITLCYIFPCNNPGNLSKVFNCKTKLSF